MQGAPTAEETIVLRVPPHLGEQLRTILYAHDDSKQQQVSFKMLTETLGSLTVGKGRKKASYQANLVDLPCLIETHKTFDKQHFYKTGDISQMLLVSGQHDPDADVGTLRSGLTPFTENIQDRFDAFKPPLPPTQISEAEERIADILAGCKDRQETYELVDIDDYVYEEVYEDLEGEMDAEAPLQYADASAMGIGLGGNGGRNNEGAARHTPQDGFQIVINRSQLAHEATQSLMAMDEDQEEEQNDTLMELTGGNLLSFSSDGKLRGELMGSPNMFNQASPNLSQSGFHDSLSSFGSRKSSPFVGGSMAGMDDMAFPFSGPQSMGPLASPMLTGDAQVGPLSSPDPAPSQSPGPAEDFNSYLRMPSPLTASQPPALISAPTAPSAVQRSPSPAVSRLNKEQKLSTTNPAPIMDMGQNRGVTPMEEEADLSIPLPTQPAVSLELTQAQEAVARLKAQVASTKNKIVKKKLERKLKAAQAKLTTLTSA